MPRRLTQPPNTSVYDVKSTDTIASIALRYNTTPTELSRLNHLSCSMLFPGQNLFVPSYSSNDEAIKDDNVELVPSIVEPHSPSHSITILQPPKKQPLQTIRQLFSPDHSLEQLLGKDLNASDDEISTRFLKIKSKYVTDGQGVVSGVLLVTPQTVMFNPSVSDHLVMDRGRESYVVRLSLKAISRLSFFEDIAAMVVGDVSKQYLPNCRFIDYDSKRSGFPKPGMVICQETGEQYILPFSKKTTSSSLENESIDDSPKATSELHPLNIKELEEVSAVNNSCHVKELNILNETDKQNDLLMGADISSDQGISTLHTISDTRSMDNTITDDTLTSPTCINTYDENSLCVTDENDSLFMDKSHSSSTPKHVEKNLTLVCQESSEQTNKEENSAPLTPDSEIEIDESPDSPVGLYEQSNSLNQQVAKLQSPNSDLSKDSGISEINTTNFSQQDPHESEHVMHEPLSNRSSLSDEARQWLGKRGIRMLSLGSEDDLQTSTKDVIPDDVLPRPASKYEDNLMYVAIKVHKNYWFSSRQKQSNVMGIPPNRDQKRRQHWFAIPRGRVDQFYSFLLHWAPDVSIIASNSSTPCSEDFLESDEGLNIVDNTFGCSPATTMGYEKLTQEDAASMKARVGSLNSVSSKTSLRSFEDETPDLLAESSLLTKLQVRLLARSLPKRTVGHSWELVYSTNLHGISLSTLYRNFYDYDSPSVIVVKDETSKLFGSFLSDAPRLSDGFYGTGESMLFTFVADNKLLPYNWSGDNSFFIKGSKTSLAIGGGEGVFGLWLDEDLYHGRSHSCKTFCNETLSRNEDFVCSGLEAWAFV